MNTCGDCRNFRLEKYCAIAVAYNVSPERKSEDKACSHFKIKDKE